MTMKNIVMATMLVISTLGRTGGAVQSSPLKVIAEFPASSLKWIRVAEPEIERQRLKLDKYTVTVIEEHDAVTVTVSGSDTVKGARGNASVYPGYVVVISKKDLKVVRSYYIR